MTSADIARQLRASRPAAPGTLHDRVQAIVAAGPPPRPTLGARLAALRPRRRPLLILVPAAAATAALAAGLVALVQPDNAPRSTVVAAPAEAPSSELGSSKTGTESYGATAPQAGAGTTADASVPSPDPGRAQRTTASLAIEVADTEALSRATQRAITTIRGLDGYLVTVGYGAAETGTATIVARVPTASVQDAVARLSSLGTIASQSVQIDDLQAALDETTRQVAVLRRRIAALTSQLERSSLTTEERARLEATRQQLRDELAGATRTARATRTEAATATIQLELRTPPLEEAVPATPSRLDRAIDDAVGVLAVEGIVVLYALVVAAPLALLGLLIWAATRGLGRRGRERLLSGS